MRNQWKLTIWGSRGSVAQLNSSKKQYGTETSCITLETEKTIMMVDCGSGVKYFDEYYYRNHLTHKNIIIFLSHYHYDHISGLPFTRFIHDNKVRVELYGMNTEYGTCTEILRTYYGRPYFPLDILDLSNIIVHDLEQGVEVKLEDIQINTIYLHHPDGCMGYKFAGYGDIITIITDYEYPLDPEKEKVEQFIENSDLLIIDSFFQVKDYRESWGHSTIEGNIELSQRTKVGQCILYHHNTEYDDEILEALEDKINKEYPNVIFAKDKMSFA